MAKFSVSGSAVKGFERLGRWMSSERPKALRKIGVYMVDETKQGFREGRDPQSGRYWKRLSTDYRRWKLSKGWSGLPLTKTSDLRRSIHYALKGTRRVAWGTGNPYGHFHQDGEGVPKRRFLGMSNRHKTELADIVGKHIRKGVK